MADPLRQTYGEVFFLTSGLQRDPYGLANFHPASNVNRLDIYLEDGVSTNVVMVNFKADGKGYPTSVFFPTLYGGTVQKVITGEASARSFAKYSLLVPPQVLQWNANGTSTLSLQTTVVQTAGDGLLGAFENYTALTTAHPATEDLMDAGSIAYVYTTVGSDEYGFYAVTYDSVAGTYSWTLVDNPVTQINMVDTKQYNIVGMQIQKGNLPRPTSTVTISDEYIRYILAYIATVNDNCNLNKDTLDDHEIRITALETDVDAIIAGTQDITFNNTISGLVATTLKGAVDEVAIAISNMKDGTSPFTKLTLTDGNGNYADIYFDGVNIIKDYRDGVLAEDSQNLYVPIKAREAFSDGDIIQYDGSVGASGKIWAKKAVQAEINENPRLILGMATTSVLANEEHERAVSFYGSVGSLNTADSLGYYVYYDSEGSTAGGYVLVNPASPTNRPTAPHVRVFIGVVAVAHATNGVINVRPDFGRKLSELHDVYLNGGAIDGSNIKYNASTLRWEVDNRTTSLVTANMFKDVSYTASTGVLLFTKYDNTTKSIDLPLELIIESGYYDEDTNELVLVLANASEIRIPVGDLLSDLDAVNIRYNNGDSTLVAVNVKTALDELDGKAETNASNITDLDNRVTANENDIDALQDKDVLHDSRINQIEEQLRTSYSDEDTATKSGTDIISMGNNVANAPLNVLVEGGLLDAPQLVTNGDFNSDLSGWTPITTSPTWVSGRAFFERLAGNPLVAMSQSKTINGLKMYASFEVEKTVDTANAIYGFGTTATIFVDFRTLSTAKQHVSTVFTANADNIYFNTNTGGTTYYLDKVKLFNISTLIANKQYSPLYDTTFDLMSDANIKTQMDTWVLNGTLPNGIMAVNMDKRIRSVGKNLFDEIENGGFNGATGVVDNTTTRANRTKNFIRIKPSVVYRISLTTPATETIIVYYYDNNQVYLGTSVRTFISGSGGTFTPPSNASFIKVAFVNLALPALPLNNNYQLELGSTASTYRPYMHSDLYLQSGEVGYKLPNGVKDTIEMRDGKAYFIRRVQKYTLVSADITALVTSDDDTDRVNTIALPLRAIDNNSSTNMYINGYTMISTSAIDYIPANIGKYGFGAGLSTTLLTFIFSKGTYASLVEAQSALAGTVIYYQLATPVEEEILAIGNAQGTPNGTVYVDDIKWGVDIYTTNIVVTDAISELVSITKMKTDGTELQLDVSSATIAGDGLSFTHTGLAIGDAVRYTYIPQGDYFKSTTDVVYYNDRLVVVDSVTSTVYKVVPTIASGVLTWTIEEV